MLSQSMQSADTCVLLQVHMMITGFEVEFKVTGVTATVS